MNEMLKRVLAVSAVVLILVVVVIAFGAMLFTDDREESFRNFFTNKPGATQPMELRGDWLGMSLVDLNSATARRYNIPPSQKGVMVAEVSETRGFRAQQAGVTKGDVVTTVNGKKVRDISDFFDATRKVNLADAIYLDAYRWGQPLTLVMPATYQPSSMATPGQAGMMQQPVMQQPVMQQPFQQPMLAQPMQQAAWAQTPDGPLWVCPRHGLGWFQRHVHPNYRCPICNGPLTRAP